MTSSLAGVVPGIIDAHIHQWDPFSTPREASRLAPLYARAPRLLERALPLLAPLADRELVITPRHVGSRYLPATYAADAAGTVAAVGVPVEAVLHVEASWHDPDPVGETRWVEGLPFGQDGAPRLAGIIAHADPRHADVAQVLDRHLAASDRVKGIRRTAAWHADRGVKNFAEEDGMLESPEFLRGFAAVAERGLTFDAWVYAGQLGQVARLASEYPETTIVLDHYGTPVGVFGPMGKGTTRDAASRADLLSRWRDDIAAVAAHPNVVAKQSGFAFPPLGCREVGIGRDDLAALAAPLIEHTADVFGPERQVFGSNFPMDKSLTEHGTVVGALHDVLAPRGAELLAKVFRENAVRVYRL
ncbi:MAG: amidohydrolase family protein [Marmoricola sp.]